MKKLRGRWSPSSAQVELVIDCARAGMSLERTAELCGVGPRSIWIFGNRAGMPFPAPAGQARAADVLMSPRAASRLAIAGASHAVWAKRRPWRARIYVGGKHLSLGYYATQTEARAAHKAAAKHYGLKLKSEDRP